MDSASYNKLSPPPLDNISSADGTECDYEEYDLEVNAVNSCTATSIAPKHYKSFQPSIKLQPTDLIYREEHSRAAPRKGIEPKAFLAIGETKQEHVQYVGRQKQPAPSKQARTVSAVNTRKQQQRQSTVYSAPPSNRNKSRASRTASGKGRHSVWSAAGYTPLPVAPPPTILPKENAYLHHPFKQDLSHETLRSDRTARLPVSPGEELKSSTILATMEVGRYINQQERTPNVSSQPREPKLLKARLKPLNTVNVTGPSINDCQGVQADQRQFGPSPMKAKLQKQLDDVIKKNAALKDISVAHYGSRTGSSKPGSRCKSSSSSKGKIKTPDSASSTKREPTPSPYASITQLDKAGAIAVSSQPPDSQAKPSRVQSATHSEASHTEQQTLARSVSAVTIKPRDIETPASHPSQPTGTCDQLSTAKVGGAKGTVFLTDADSIVDSTPVSTKAAVHPQHKPPAAPKSQGCKGFEEKKPSRREDDDDDDDKGKPADKTSSAQGGSSTEQSQASSQQGQQQNGGESGGSIGKQHPLQPQECGAPQAAGKNFISTPSTNTCKLGKIQKQGVFDDSSATPTSDGKVNGTKRDLGKYQNGKFTKERYTQPEEEATFITAGFLTLESMIKDARRMLRHSYSLNDLDMSCDWDQPLSSPRSVEVLHKEVTFADVEDRCFVDSREDHFYDSEKLILTEYNEPKLDLVPVKEPLLDAFPCERRPANNDKVSAKVPPTSLDSIQKELAARASPFGIYGEISEYLTTKTLFREICLPPKPPKQEVTLNMHALSSDFSCFDNDSVECFPVNPPSTPCLGVSGGSLTPVSECFTPDDSGSVVSDWEPLDDGKSFFETFVDLAAKESKSQTEAIEESSRKCSTVSDELPQAIEGHSKPVTVRQPVGALEPIAKVAPACFRINSLAPEGHVFYFTYDADLNHQRFSTLIGRTVTDKHWALLFGFQLVFNKKGLDAEAGTFANIESNPYSSTEGAVYAMSHDELTLVDAHHGYPEHYARLVVPVWMCNSGDPAQYNLAQYCVPAVTYIAQNTWTCPKQNLPASSKEYSLRQVLHGADQLSSGFKQHLNSMLQECCC